MAPVAIPVRVQIELRDRIDAIRGDLTRSEWMRRAIERAVTEAERGGAPLTEDSYVGIAPEGLTPKVFHVVKRPTRVQTVECPDAKDGSHDYRQEKGESGGTIKVCRHCGDRRLR